MGNTWWILITLVGLFAITGANCLTTPVEEPVIFNDGFETGLGSWMQGSDVPEDPNNPGNPVAWAIEQSDAQAVEGRYSARFCLDGGQDDGTIWLVREFDVTAGRVYSVMLSLSLWSESESFNTLAKVAAYAGGKAPDAESDFDVSMAADQVAGWKTYTYVIDATATTNGKIRVAFGISAVWETQLTYYIDDVAIEIEPK
ncbi:MAG TPA: hypothetical protein PLL20_14620 [Phycisphaerae bacterium]|nr:hypothetical protein [Phycisphaerae bacterium]HRR85822.1 hypothetical protein [Phycisphaerae bacterium]